MVELLFCSAKSYEYLRTLVTFGERSLLWEVLRDSLHNLS